jgi:hypothetical protein
MEIEVICDICIERFRLDVAKHGFCPQCGQSFVWKDGPRMELTEYQLKALREVTLDKNIYVMGT